MKIKISIDRLKGFFAGILLTMGSWMWVITLREQILKISPFQNQYILGAIFVLIAWYLGVKK